MQVQRILSNNTTFNGKANSMATAYETVRAMKEGAAESKNIKTTYNYSAESLDRFFEQQEARKKEFLKELEVFKREYNKGNRTNNIKKDNK